MAKRRKNQIAENTTENEAENEIKKVDVETPDILEIKDKVDLSDTAIAVEDITDKKVIEEKKFEEVSEEPKKEEPKKEEPKKEEPKKEEPKKEVVKPIKQIKPKKVKKVEVKIKETEVTTLPPFDIDEDFFNSERNNKKDIKEVNRTYAIDQFAKL